jgi:hypothetical protein
MAPVGAFYGQSPSLEAAGTHSYFDLMTLDGSVQTMERNYPSWATYGSADGGSASSVISQNRGLQAAIMGPNGWTDYGVVNSSALYFSGNPAVLSFQISTGPDYQGIPGEGRVVVAPTYQVGGSVLNTQSYVDFCVCERYAQFNLKANGVLTTLYKESAESEYSAWAVVLGSLGVGLEIYLDIGNGFNLVYNNSNLNIGFDYGYVYAFSRTNIWSVASFAYISSWTVNSPMAEATIDQNVWYLARHYEQITSGKYANDAVILDTDAPPLWLEITNPGPYYMYAGMSPENTNGPSPDCQQNSCNVVSGVIQTTPTTQTLAYLFCFGAQCNAFDLQAAENGGTLSGAKIAFVEIQEGSDPYFSGQVNYAVSVTTCTSNCGISALTVYLGGTALPNGKVVQTFFGLPGMRFVSRHITYVTGLLFKELGYSAVAQPLLNYLADVMVQCGCDLPYQEFYSPMFPSVVNNSQLPNNWYDTDHAFPGANFYAAMTDGTASGFQIPNAAGYSQWSDPYISRLALFGAQQFWLYGPMGKDGFDATARAMQVEYKVDTANGVSSSDNVSRLAYALSQVGWNGIGTSEKTCVSTEGILQNPKQVCYTETAFPTYATAAFLSAASAVAAFDGDPRIASEANQAANVLESLLWSGNGSIAGDPNVQLMWQYTGGEDSAYNPVSPHSQLLQYSSNQQGVFGAVSEVIEQWGFAGVQPPESPGYEPVATEATGLTAAALLNYVKYLSLQPSKPSNGAYVADVGINLDTTIYCSNGNDCLYSTANTGSISFKLTQTGDEMIGTVEEPYIVQQPTPAAYAEDIFELNGTVNGSVYLYLKLVDSTTGNTVFSAYTPLGSGQYTNKFYLVSGQMGTTLKAGSYLAQMQFVALGPVDFIDNWGSLQALGVDVLPNTISDNFPLDGGLNQGWAPFKIGSGYCTTNVVNPDGFEVYIKNATSAPFECGIVSDSPISYDGGGLNMYGIEQLYNGFGTGGAIAISPDLAKNTPIEDLPNYLILENGGPFIVNGTLMARIITRSNGGTPVTTSFPWSSQNIAWMVSMLPNLMGVWYNGTSSWIRVGFPASSFNSNLTSVYVYLYQEANTTGQFNTVVNFPTIEAQGSVGLELVPDSAQTVDYGANWYGIPNSNQMAPQTGDGISLAQFLPSQANNNQAFLYSTGSTTGFNFMETVSFWMIPYTVGGNNPPNTGSSTMVVDNGGCCGSWWFEYWNSGELDFKYVLGGTTYTASSLYDLTQVNVPYFITGVYNSSGNSISLYINGFLQHLTPTSGGPDMTTTRTLYVGTGLCGPGDGCYGGNFKGLISGLSLTPYIIASTNQVDQLMTQGGFSGSHIGGGYWYPLTNANGSLPNQFQDLFQAGPPLASQSMSMGTVQNDFPYPWLSSTWDPYLEPNVGYPPNANNPYHVYVDTSDGVYGSCLCNGPSLFVSEATGLSNLNYSGPVGGFNLAPVDLSTYNGQSQLILSFKYRTEATPKTNANLFYLRVTNSSGSVLFANTYYQSTTGDSGWQNFQLNLASYVKGSKNIEIFLGLINYWATDYNQLAWFNNVQVYASTQPSFYALSLYRYEPKSEGNPSGYTYSAQGAVEVPNYLPPAGSFTVSVWFEPVDVSFGDNPRIVANDHTDYGNTAGHGFEISYANGGQRLDMFLGNGSAFVDIAFTSADLSNGVWYNAVMTYDGSQLCGYLTPANGKTSSVCENVKGAFSLATGYYPVSVGFDPAYQGDFFPGVVSDLRIYNYPLPLSSVVQLGANGPTNNNIPPNSLWLELAGSFSDALGSGVTAVPYIGTGWYENYVTFTAEL